MSTRLEAEQASRNVLANHMGDRTILAKGKPSKSPSGANALTAHLRLPGGLTLYRLISGDFALFVSYEVGIMGGFERLGFEWIVGFGWLGVSPNIDGLVSIFSSLKG